MEYVLQLAKILARYRVEIQSLEVFEDCIRLTSEKGNTIHLPYDILDSACKEGVARLILFAVDPDRAASAYWKFTDWDTLELEASME